MRYAIAAPILDKASAGVGALYRLNADLKALGERSRIVLINPYATTASDEIVVYPDTISGNLFNARNVVRYLLMHAGFFGADPRFDDSELMYYHSPDFIVDDRNSENILTIPMTDESRFPYRTEGRFGSCYLARKYEEVFGQRPTDLPAGCIRITNQTELAGLFGFIKTLITFDNSAINLEAALAGVEVEYRFNPTFESPISLGPDFDWNNPHASYKRLKERYRDEQLPGFIKRTKERFT